MNGRFITLLVLASLLLGRTPDIQAAEISCPGDQQANVTRVVGWVGLPAPTPYVCMHVLLQGDTERGDFDTFKSMLRQNEPYVDTVALLSPGGDVSESLKIGALIRQRMLKTQAPRVDAMRQHLLIYPAMKFSCIGDQCYCASACFFIWASGINRTGDALLVHRPHDASGSFGGKQATIATAEYTAMLGAVSNHLTQMDLPPAIIAYVKSVSSNRAS